MDGQLFILRDEHKVYIAEFRDKIIIHTYENGLKKFKNQLHNATTIKFNNFVSNNEEDVTKSLIKYLDNMFKFHNKKNIPSMVTASYDDETITVPLFNPNVNDPFTPQMAPVKNFTGDKKETACDFGFIAE